MKNCKSCEANQIHFYQNSFKNMHKPKVSVIVPVYKAEAYLCRCVDSLLAQTFQDYEILLIDDGSPDKSGKICDEYARKDSRIRVFHKENGGVSSARQCGIDNALGEYTIHADPDDWVEPNMLEELYVKAKEENADMVICDYYENKSGKITLRELMLGGLSSQSLLKKFLKQELHAATWNKLIKKSCYVKYNVEFPLNIIRWEDLYVICKFLLHPIKIAYLPKAYYYYDLTINSDSIVRKPTIQGLMSQIYFIEYFSKILDDTIFNEELYNIKAATKELAFASKLISDKEVYNLYKEINEEYIAQKKIIPVHICLSLFLKGYPCLSRFFFAIYMTARNIFSSKKI